MSKKDKALLEENEWIVENLSPLEIRNRKTNDFASGISANAILGNLKYAQLKKGKKDEII